jgi:[ribosomal protein S5]-alanine N-acetyltransferase
MPDIILTTARMTLRLMNPADGNNLLRILGDPMAMRHYPKVYTPETVHEWLDRNLDRYARDGHGFYICELKESGEFVGQCGLLTQDVDGVRELEVGYLFVPNFWNRGLATEAARACRDHGFHTYPVAQIISIIAPTNLPSIRVAEKNGMILWKETLFKDLPHRVYRMKRDDWSRLQGMATVRQLASLEAAVLS